MVNGREREKRRILGEAAGLIIREPILPSGGYGHLEGMEGSRSR